MEIPISMKIPKSNLLKIHISSNLRENPPTDFKVWRAADDRTSGQRPRTTVGHAWGKSVFAGSVHSFWSKCCQLITERTPSGTEIAKQISRRGRVSEPKEIQRIPPTKGPPLLVSIRISIRPESGRIPFTFRANAVCHGKALHLARYPVTYPAT